MLDELAAIYGYPKYLRIDNGTELTSKIMQQWSEDHCVELLFIQPGKPTQNAYIDRSTRASDASSSTRIGSDRCLEARHAADGLEASLQHDPLA